MNRKARRTSGRPSVNARERWAGGGAGENLIAPLISESRG